MTNPPKKNRVIYGTARANSQKTHCSRGHTYTPENTLRIPSKPNTRICRACRRESSSRYRRPKIQAGRDTDPTLFVYFISDDLGHIKIGVAKDVSLRREGLQTASPTELRIEATQRGGVPVEKKLHARFSDARMIGEWFHFTPEIAMYVNDLKGGT